MSPRLCVHKNASENAFKYTHRHSASSASLNNFTRNMLARASMRWKSVVCIRFTCRNTQNVAHRIWLKWHTHTQSSSSSMPPGQRMWEKKYYRIKNVTQLREMCKRQREFSRMPNERVALKLFTGCIVFFPCVSVHTSHVNSTGNYWTRYSVRNACYHKTSVRFVCSRILFIRLSAWCVCVCVCACIYCGQAAHWIRVRCKHEHETCTHTSGSHS